jgi:1-acyl-sn-glycerol-3-phosphate acyltransferase
LSASNLQDVKRNLPHPLVWIPLQLYKWFIIIPVMVLSTTLASILVILLSALGMPNFSSRFIGTGWAKLNMLFSLMSVEVQGRELVNPEQSYIIVANHQSLADIYVVYGYSGIDFKWVMKKELRSIPLFGLACEMMGHIIVDRSNTTAALESINLARSSIKDGISVVFFAEGTRSRKGEIDQFKKGAFRLALELGLPILPVSIHNTSKVLPSDTLDWHPGHVKLKFHEPISTTGMNMKDVSSLRDQTRTVIAAALAQD